MSSPALAPCAAVATGAPCAASLSPTRAAASRRNGARSRGPKTPEGKARSAQNALKHGMRAQKCILLPGERAAAFAAFGAALLAELAPQGALQTVLAQRIVAASWRLARSERLEAELFVEARLDGASPGLALALAVIRDGHGARAFDTLLRYRGSANAELWRALRTLKALQAEAVSQAAQEAEQAPQQVPEPRLLPEPRALPNESKIRANPGSRAPIVAADDAGASQEPAADVDAGGGAADPGMTPPWSCPRSAMPQSQAIARDHTDRTRTPAELPGNEGPACCKAAGRRGSGSLTRVRSRGASPGSTATLATGPLRHAASARSGPLAGLYRADKGGPPGKAAR